MSIVSSSVTKKKAEPTTATAPAPMSILSSRISQAGPPVSLEAERRKTMTIVHSVEREILAFKERHLKKMRTQLPEDIQDVVQFVVERNQVKRYPRNADDFINLLNKIRDAAEVAFKKEVDMIEEVMDLFKNYKAAIQSISDKLREALEDHVGKYCHSFSAEAGNNDIPAVQFYENNITRWRTQINEAFNLLGDILGNIRDSAHNFEQFLTNYPRIAHYMAVSFEVFPRIYNPLKDWVTSDEAYVRRLQDDMCQLKQEKMAVDGVARRQKMHAGGIQSKVTRSQHHTKKLRLNLVRARDERRACRRRELSVLDATSKVEDQLAAQREFLDDTLQALYQKEDAPSTDRARLMESSTAISKDVHRLEKKMRALKLELKNVKNQRIDAQKEFHRMQVLCEKNARLEIDIQDDADDATQDARDLEGERRVLGEKVIALARIRAIKLHPMTVKVIYSEGYTPGRKFEVEETLEEACRIAASEVGRDWPATNQLLPGSPRRESPRRESPRRESGPPPAGCRLLPDLSARSDPGPGGAFRDYKKNKSNSLRRDVDRWARASREAPVNALGRTLHSMRTQQELSSAKKDRKIITVN